MRNPIRALGISGLDRWTVAIVAALVVLAGFLIYVVDCRRYDREQYRRILQDRASIGKLMDSLARQGDDLSDAITIIREQDRRNNEDHRLIHALIENAAGYHRFFVERDARSVRERDALKSAVERLASDTGNTLPDDWWPEGERP